MFLKKLNIYIILSVFIITILLTSSIYAFTDDSIYVWSSSLDDLPTATAPEKENSLEDNSTENNTRQLFRYNFWKCYTYGTKYRNYFI